MPAPRSKINVSDALEIATSALPHSESRPGQKEMAHAVDEALHEGKHLIVQAGTGTGKTIAYLVPAIVAGKRTVVTTAPKALQDQLATTSVASAWLNLTENPKRRIEKRILRHCLKLTRCRSQFAVRSI